MLYSRLLIQALSPFYEEVKYFPTMCLISEFAEKCEGLAVPLNKALQHSEGIKKYSKPCFHLHFSTLETKLIPCSSEEK